MCQVLLQSVYTLGVELNDIGMCAKCFAISKLYAVLTCIILKQSITGHDECTHELTLIGHYHGLVKVSVKHQLRLYHLWCYVFAVRGFEQVFDALTQKEFTILHIACIACVEPAIIVNGLFGLRILFVIAWGDGFATKQYFIILAKLDFYFVNQASYRT